MQAMLQQHSAQGMSISHQSKHRCFLKVEWCSCNPCRSSLLKRCQKHCCQCLMFLQFLMLTAITRLVDMNLQTLFSTWLQLTLLMAASRNRRYKSAQLSRHQCYAVLSLMSSPPINMWCSARGNMHVSQHQLTAHATGNGCSTRIGSWRV